MTIGARLREARQARKMSLAALASASGLSKGFLSQVESGATNPSLGSLQRLADALSLSASSLVSTEAVGRELSVPPGPRLVRRVHAPRDRSSIMQTSSTGQSIVYVADLLPGAALEAVALSTADAYLMVLRGEVEFEQDSSLMRLSEGDSLTFSLSQNYRLSAHKRFRVSLLLVLRSEQDLPRLSESPRREASGPVRESASAGAEFRGPLRLVAMRAARAERGR